MTCTQFGLQAFQHGNSCISRILAQFFSRCLIVTKLILNESLGQHDQNDASCTHIGPQIRKLLLIKVLTLQVRISLNEHVYIGLYLTHACQKHFWNGRKTDFSAHARSTMHGQKRQVEKVTQKKNVLNDPEHNAEWHFNFSKQCRPLIFKPVVHFLILVPAVTKILKHSAGWHCVPRQFSACFFFLSFLQ